MKERPTGAEELSSWGGALWLGDLKINKYPSYYYKCYNKGKAKNTVDMEVLPLFPVNGRSVTKSKDMRASLDGKPNKCAS